MIESIQDIYDSIFKELRAYLIENSKYNPYVDNKEPNVKRFPVVIIEELRNDSIYTTLKYTDKIYYMDLEINVYAMQSNGISNKTIANEITNLVEKFFEDNYRVSILTKRGMANIDTSVYRNLTTIKFKVETKYKDKLIISPR